MPAQVFYILGALPLMLLGAVHLVFTLHDNRKPRYIVPKSESLIRSMQVEPLRLTSETDMWRAWIGFNISHSIAVLLVGLGFLYLAVRYFEFMSQDIILLWTAPTLAWVSVILSKCFWFSRPFRGSFISAVLFTIGALLNVSAG